MPKNDTITLNTREVATLVAFLDTFDLRLTGVWAQIEAGMREDFCVDDPEAEMEQIREKLSGA